MYNNRKIQKLTLIPIPNEDINWAENKDFFFTQRITFLYKAYNCIHSLDYWIHQMKIIIGIYICRYDHKKKYNFKPKHINDLFNVSEFFFISFFFIWLEATQIIPLINNKSELLLPSFHTNIYNASLWVTYNIIERKKSQKNGTNNSHF